MMNVNFTEEDVLFSSDNEDEVEGNAPHCSTTNADAGSAAAGGKDESSPSKSHSGAVSSSASSASKKHYFLKELRCMMYGFGDDRIPYSETVELLEALVVRFIIDVTQKAMQVGKPGKIALEDIWYLIRRDAKKYGRVKDLLAMSEELKRARKAFDETRYNST